MPSLSQFAAFAAVAILFVEIPGPSLLFTIGRALSVGRRDALLSVLGNALGLLVQVVCVAVGLGALVAASATAFTILRMAGALYVAYLGIQAIRHRADARVALEARVAARRTTSWRSVRTGLVVGATNPKTIIFFAAFLPQFVDTHAAAGPQLLVLGLLFAVLACVSDSIWALAASRARDWFARRPTRLDKLGASGGVMMIGLGATLAATGNSS